MKPTRLLYFTIVVTTMAHAQSFDDLHKQIESFKPEMEIRDIGTVVEAGDGIARFPFWN